MLWFMWYPSVKDVWHDLIKTLLALVLLAVLQISALLVLDTQVHCSLFLSLQWDCANSHISAWPTSACSVFHFAFPVSQHTMWRCLPRHVSSTTNRHPLIQTETKRQSPSDKLTRWLMKPCMGDKDARGCRWILTLNGSWWYQYNRGSQITHTQ